MLYITVIVYTRMPVIDECIYAYMLQFYIHELSCTRPATMRNGMLFISSQYIIHKLPNVHLEIFILIF
jgi:hypothetical protein